MSNNKELIDIFKKVALKYPENIAITENGVNYSYISLDKFSNKIANFLLSKDKQNNVIGIILPSSFFLISSMIGTLKSGNTYLLIDPNMPKNRIKNMLETANCKDIITTYECKKDIAIPDLNYYTLNDIKLFKDSFNNSLHYLNDIAYIIFTSGTTGVPKGVRIKSSSIINLVCSNKFITIYDTDVISQASNISFDAITFEVWGALLNGATIAIAKKETLLNLNVLKQWLQETEVSIMFLTTALFNKYIDLFPELFQIVSKILFGGEKANVSKINMLLDIPRKCEIIHVYGPTETTTFATFCKIDEKLDVYPIGEPISGVYTYILDENLNTAREGELYIGGEGVANGYINTSNANSFVRIPDIDKNLLYKTGDWVKLNRLGLIEYIGRIDNQIKINGFRLEIEELTSILNSHNKIKDACIYVNSQKKLYAFYVGYSISEEELRDYILKYIPSFMLPHSINEVQAFPLTSNNKIDTKKLYNDLISKNSIQSKHLEDFDHILLDIFSNVLKIDKSNIALDSNFFRIGGDSLSALLAINRINEYISNPISMNNFIDHPTVTSLKKLLINKSNNKEKFIVDQSKEIKMSSSQKSFWYLHQILADKSSYNVHFILKFSKNIDWNILDKSIDILISKNEILRTTFTFKNSEFVQKIHDKIKKEIYCFSDYSSSKVEELLSLPFEIEQQPPLRFIYIRNHENPELIIVLHHIITDGWSNNKLVHQLSYIYDCLIQGFRPTFKVTQYRNFSEWHNTYIKSYEFSKELGYWIKELEEFKPNKIISTNKKGKIETIEISFACLENSYWSQRKQLHAYSNYMIVVSMYALLLKKITGLNEFLIGIPIFNRPNPTFEEMLGSCVNTLPINISFTNITTIEQFFEDTKRKLLNLYSYQNVPLNIINQNISYDISTFQMLCINQQFDNRNYKSKTFRSVEYNPNMGSKNHKYDFSLQMNPDLSATIQYNSNIISEENFNQLIDKMMGLLEIPLLNKNINSVLEDIDID